MKTEAILITRRTTKHTPGPWSYTRCEVSGKYFVEVRRGLHKSCIAEVPREPTEQHGGSAEANARLMAAAPELLEACKAALGPLQDAYNATQKTGHETEAARVFLAVKAAISKATAE